MQDVVKSLTDELAKVRAQEKAIADEARAKAATVTDERKRIEKALKALNPGASSNGSKERNYDPAKLAGEKNIEAVAEYVRFRGKVRQKDISKDLDKNAGTISMVLQVLQERKEARPTGETDDRSKVWEWIGKPARKTRARRRTPDKAAA